MNLKQDKRGWKGRMVKQGVTADVGVPGMPTGIELDNPEKKPSRTAHQSSGTWFVRRQRCHSAASGDTNSTYDHLQH
jgi:hypothetical protein